MATIWACIHGGMHTMGETSMSPNICVSFLVKRGFSLMPLGLVLGWSQLKSALHLKGARPRDRLGGALLLGSLLSQPHRGEVEVDAISPNSSDEPECLQIILGKSGGVARHHLVLVGHSSSPIRRSR